MEPDGSITLLIEQVRRGDERAAQELFNRYFTQLLGVAGRKLAGSPRSVEDEEDVVLSALDSFIDRARKQEFPQLKDRNNLWPLLLKITERKAINQRKRQLAKKRGGGKVVSAGALGGSESDSRPAVLAGIKGPDPTPETILQLAEQCRHLFNLLDDELLCTVARMKLEGYTNEEIAQALDVVERTVERKLKLIRDRWSEELLKSS